MTNTIATKSEQLTYMGKKWDTDSFDHELVHYLLKATQVVMNQLGCNRQEALGYICRDWMELKGVPVVDGNLLRPRPTPMPTVIPEPEEEFEVRPNHTPKLFGVFNRGSD
jgi:hypothetical protein